jgi:hypothetical protein
MYYSKHVDPTYRDDLTRRSRAFLLRFSLDIKLATERTLANLPETRAKVLADWIQDGSNYYKYSLSHAKRQYLKIDRQALKDNIRGKQPTHKQHVCGLLYKSIENQRMKWKRATAPDADPKNDNVANRQHKYARKCKLS